MSEITVTINKYREVNKGFLKAFFSLSILPLGIEISDCKYFVKDANRWFSFPSKELKDSRDGSTKYIPLVKYVEANDLAKQLNQSVLDALQNQTYEDVNESRKSSNPKTKVPSDPSFIW